MARAQSREAGSRVLALCQKRLAKDWEETFGHGVLLLETFVDPERFRGTVYRAANWVYGGNTRGFCRTHLGYSASPQSPKMVFLKPLRGVVVSFARDECSKPQSFPRERESPPRTFRNMLFTYWIPPAMAGRQ